MRCWAQRWDLANRAVADRGPLLFGLIAEHFDVTAAWLTSGALTTLATVTLIVVRARSR
ncbi:MAG: hypothetical protein ACRDST_12410 [Pseudonocardiaceae bacterium]